MLDITNNPVGFEPPKSNTSAQPSPVAPNSGIPNAPISPPNTAHPAEAKSAEKNIPAVPAPKFEDSKIEPIKTNTSGMNTFAKLFLVATVIFVVGHIAFYLYYLANNNQIKTLDKKLADKTADLTTLKPIQDKAEILLTANKELTKYYSDRVDWRALWTEVDSRLLKRSQITSFTLDEKGTFNISGQTSSLTDLAKTIVSFKSSKILQNIKMTGTSFAIDEKGQVKVTFSLTGNVDLTSVRIK